MTSLRSLPFRAMVPATFGSEGSEITVAVAGQGLLRSEKDGLVIEIQAQHASEVRTQRVSLSDLSDVDLKSSWARTRLILRPRRLEAFEGLTTRGALALSVARRDRALASTWATALTFAILEREV